MSWQKSEHVDRPFFDKFSNSVFFKDEKDFLASLAREIERITSSRLRFSSSATENLPTTKEDPYAYGFQDLSCMGGDLDWVEKYERRFVKTIISLEPRIRDCNIELVEADTNTAVLHFLLTFTLKDSHDIFSKNFYVRK